MSVFIDPKLSKERLQIMRGVIKQLRETYPAAVDFGVPPIVVVCAAERVPVWEDILPDAQIIVLRDGAWGVPNEVITLRATRYKPSVYTHAPEAVIIWAIMDAVTVGGKMYTENMRRREKRRLQAARRVRLQKMDKRANRDKIG